MIVQFVQFETALTEEEALAISKQRQPAYEATPGLIQKYYLRLEKPGHFGGFMVWESREALAAFRESDLAKTIPTAYKAVGKPEIRILEMMFALRPEALPQTLMTA